MESTMKVKEAMHKGVEWVAPETKLKDVAQKMRDADVGAIPVGKKDRLVGMVTDRDIAIRAVSAGESLSDVTAGDVMTKGIVYCFANEEVDDAVRIMEEKQIRRLPVIDDNKRMVGMLALGDVAQAEPAALVGEVMKAVADHHA